MAHEKLKALPCYKQLHDRIVARVPLQDIVSWLQDDQKAFPDVKPDSVYRALTRYKADIPVAELMPPPRMQERLDEAAEDLDELSALGQLFRLQWKRINRAVAVEETINLNTKLAADIAEARQILEQSAALKFKLGVYKAAERTVNINHNMSSAKVIDALKPDERRRASVLAVNILKQLTAGSPGNPAVEAAMTADIDDAEEVPFELVINPHHASRPPIHHAEDPS